MWEYRVWDVLVEDAIYTEALVSGAPPHKENLRSFDEWKWHTIHHPSFFFLSICSRRLIIVTACTGEHGREETCLETAFHTNHVLEHMWSFKKRRNNGRGEDWRDRGSGRELEGVEGKEAVVGIYCIREKSISNKIKYLEKRKEVFSYEWVMKKSLLGIVT